MLFVAAVVIGEIVGSVLWHSLSGSLDRPAFMRTNYRDHALVTGAGIVVPLGAWAIAAAAAVIEPLELVGAGAPLLLVITGFGLVGLVDDVGGVGESGGFRGHLRALSQGRITTGALKLVGGPLVAIAALGGLRPDAVDLIRAAAIVSLSANLMNLFDRAPGRVIKVSGIWLVALGAGAWARYSDLGSLAPVAGAVAVGFGLLRPDLQEDAMVGDVGSNALGAALGFGLFSVLTPAGEWIALVCLVVANLASERWSFSRIIDSVGPLRWLDRLGTRPERRQAA